MGSSKILPRGQLLANDTDESNKSHKHEVPSSKNSELKDATMQHRAEDSTVRR